MEPLVFSVSMKERTGTSVTNTRSAFSRRRQSVLTSVGLSLETVVSFVSAKFEASYTWTAETWSTQGHTTTRITTKETRQAKTFDVHANSIIRLFQVQGSCRDYDVGSDVFISTDKTGDIPNPIPAKGYICERPPELRKNKKPKYPSGMESQLDSLLNPERTTKFSG